MRPISVEQEITKQFPRFGGRGQLKLVAVALGTELAKEENSERRHSRTFCELGPRLTLALVRDHAVDTLAPWRTSHLLSEDFQRVNSLCEVLLGTT